MTNFKLKQHSREIESNVTEDREAQKEKQEHQLQPINYGYQK